MLEVARDGAVGRLSAIVARIAEQHELKGSISPAVSLVDAGLTSMAMVDLMLAIEAEFDVTIPQGAMTPANFTSINSLAHMLDGI